MSDADLCDLLQRAACALDCEQAWLVDVEHDDRGRSKPSVPPRDRDLFDALGETAESLRGLIALIHQRAK